MPFLDARALKIDPEGIAFLSDALGRQPSEPVLPVLPPHESSARSQERLDLIRRRLERLLSAAAGS